MARKNGEEEEKKHKTKMANKWPPENNTALTFLSINRSTGRIAFNCSLKVKKKTIRNAKPLIA